MLKSDMMTTGMEEGRRVAIYALHETQSKMMGREKRLGR
jgi:hypothetical protein